MGKKELVKCKKASSKRKKKKSRSSSSSRRSSISSSSSSSSSISLSSIDEETKKKLIKKLKKLKKKEKQRKQEKKLKKRSKSEKEPLSIGLPNVNQGPCKSLMVDTLEQKSKSLAPMSKAEWEKQQNTFRHVFDKETQRMRLVKGSGEIVEECVSKKRHLAINKQATKGDGEYFQKTLQKHTRTN